MSNPMQSRQYGKRLGSSKHWSLCIEGKSRPRPNPKAKEKRENKGSNAKATERNLKIGNGKRNIVA